MYNEHNYYAAITPGRSRPRRYGFWKFMGDLLMTTLTGGAWLIWIFIREMRRR